VFQRVSILILFEYGITHKVTPRNGSGDESWRKLRDRPSSSINQLRHVVARGESVVIMNESRTTVKESFKRECHERELTKSYPMPSTRYKSVSPSFKTIQEYNRISSLACHHRDMEIKDQPFNECGRAIKLPTGSTPIIKTSLLASLNRLDIPVSVPPMSVHSYQYQIIE
jgi:hypothetical protein